VAEVRPVYQTGVDSYSLVNPEVKSPISTMMVRCYGASIRMRQPSSRSWQNRTVPSVVREVVSSYRFSSEIEDHPYVWPVIAQPGINDWEMLRNLAAMIGYRVQATATHLRFYDPAGVVQRPHIVPRLTTRKMGVMTSPTIKEFRPTFGGVTGGGYSGVIVADGFDTLTGKGFTLTSVAEKPLLGIDRPSVSAARQIESNAGTVGQARVELDAARRESLWPITATIISSGSTDIVPGNLVNVQGFNTEYDGLWYTKSVEHLMENGKFESTIEVGKDATGALDVQLPNLIVQRPPVPMMISNEWVSSRAA
jgi:phage protein D